MPAAARGGWEKGTGGWEVMTPKKREVLDTRRPEMKGRGGLKLTPGQRLFMLPFHLPDCLKCLEKEIFMG